LCCKHTQKIYYYSMVATSKSKFQMAKTNFLTIYSSIKIHTKVTALLFHISQYLSVLRHMGLLLSRDLHIRQTFSVCFAVPHVSPPFVILFTVVLLHVSLGRPVFLFPSGVDLRAIPGRECSCIYRTWPIHFHH
jgi:hypothetical protein